MIRYDIKFDGTMEAEREGEWVKYETYSHVEAENNHLRRLLATSNLPCIYCELSVEDMNKCVHGFPGCARGDDLNV